MRQRRFYAFLCAILLVGVVLMALRSWSESRWRANSARSERTNSIIRCLNFAEYNYFDVNGAYPPTLDDYLAAAVSERYCEERYCTTVVRDDILSKCDGWGRPLQFDRRTLENGIIEVTVVSLGLNGKRDFTGWSYLDEDPKGDDVVGHFYLDPSGGDRRNTRGQQRRAN